MNKVVILMSTYNGEKYIKEQIDSILEQKDVEIQLIIRDDGSKDRTVNIIKEYIKTNANIILINDDEIVNVGVKQSYFNLLSYALELNVKYFAFADQDDVWLDNKIINGVKAVKGSNNPKGALYYSNKTFVDSSLKMIREENIRYYSDYFDVLWPSLASGCTMVFNREMVEYALKCYPELDCIHDSWMYRVAMCIGSDVFFGKQSCILYRQHDNNVCGMGVNILHHDTKYQLTHIISNLFKKRDHGIQQFIKEIRENYYTELKDEYRAYIDHTLNYNTSIKSKIKLIVARPMRKRDVRTQLIWFYKIVFNMI